MARIGAAAAAEEVGNVKIHTFVAVASFSVSSLSGCSFVFVSGPPSHIGQGGPSGPVECTSSKAAPIIDTIIAGYQVFRTGYALSADDSAYVDSPIKREPDIALGATLTAPFAGAATYGYIVTGHCSDTKQAQLRWTPTPVPVSVPAPPAATSASPSRAPLAGPSAPSPVLPIPSSMPGPDKSGSSTPDAAPPPAVEPNDAGRTP